MWVSLDFISEGAEERFHTKLLINKNISFARLPDSGLLRFSLLFRSHFSPATLLFPLVTAFRISFSPSSLCTPELPQHTQQPTHAHNTAVTLCSLPLWKQGRPARLLQFSAQTSIRLARFLFTVHVRTLIVKSGYGALDLDTLTMFGV